MTKREDLDANLASADAALDADWVKTSPNLMRMRTGCRHLRAALVELDGSNTAANSDKARTFCRAMRAVLLELAPCATIPFRCDETSCLVLGSPRTTCWLDCLEGVIAAPPFPAAPAVVSATPPGMPPSAPARAIRRSGIDTPVQKQISRNARTEPSLARQAVGLLALTSAYLAYFHVDVQLQILMLPSISTYLP